MTSSFGDEKNFWDRRRAALPGDWHRMKVLNCLKEIGLKGKTVLDAGCGTGYFTDLLQRAGAATVLGIDRDATMLPESGNPGTSYVYGRLDDLARGRYEEYDWVTSVSVLMYNDANTLYAFYHEAEKILRSGGRLAVSVTHPELYRGDSPARRTDAEGRERPCWIRFDPLPVSMEGTRMFRQRYRNAVGQESVQEVYDHRTEVYASAGLAAGLVLERLWSADFPEDMASDDFGREYGYPCYLFLIFRKP